MTSLDTGSSQPYCRAARFVRDEEALAAYIRLQATLRTHRDVDLSAYRVLINGVSHVVILGAAPGEEVAAQIVESLSAGQVAVLPAGLRETLVGRRGQQAALGRYVEHHYRPGWRLQPVWRPGAGG